jgi:hypothetical protein
MASRDAATDGSTNDSNARKRTRRFSGFSDSETDTEADAGMETASDAMPATPVAAGMAVADPADAASGMEAEAAYDATPATPATADAVGACDSSAFTSSPVKRNKLRLKRTL